MPTGGGADFRSYLAGPFGIDNVLCHSIQLFAPFQDNMRFVLYVPPISDELSTVISLNDVNLCLFLKNIRQKSL
jgi:hypothetical protein